MGWREILDAPPQDFSAFSAKSHPRQNFNHFNHFNPIGQVSENPRVGLEEASRLYRERSWVMIYSGHLGDKIYLVQDDKVKTPDSSILRYSQSELDDLRDLSLEERKIMHEAKKVFSGVISKDNVSV